MKLLPVIKSSRLKSLPRLSLNILETQSPPALGLPLDGEFETLLHSGSNHLRYISAEDFYSLEQFPLQGGTRVGPKGAGPQVQFFIYLFIFYI